MRRQRRRCRLELLESRCVLAAFLGVDSIPGGVSDPNFQDHIAIDSFSWGFDWVGPERELSLRELQLTKEFDRASPVLMERVATNRSREDVTLALTKPFRGEESSVLAVKLGNARPTAFEAVDVSNSPVDEFAFDFQSIEFDYANRDDSGIHASNSRWDVVANTVTQAGFESDTPLTGGETFLTINVSDPGGNREERLGIERYEWSAVATDISASSAEAGRFIFTRPFDEATPGLFYSAVAGEITAIDQTITLSDQITVNGTDVTNILWTIHHPRITSFDIDGSALPGTTEGFVATNTFELEYSKVEVLYTTHDEFGAALETSKVTWDVTKNKIEEPVQGLGGNRVSPDDSLVLELPGEAEIKLQDFAWGLSNTVVGSAQVPQGQSTLDKAWFTATVDSSTPGLIGTLATLSGGDLNTEFNLLSKIDVNGTQQTQTEWIFRGAYITDIEIAAFGDPGLDATITFALDPSEIEVRRTERDASGAVLSANTADWNKTSQASTATPTLLPLALAQPDLEFAIEVTSGPETVIHDIAIDAYSWDVKDEASTRPADLLIFAEAGTHSPTLFHEVAKSDNFWGKAWITRHMTLSGQRVPLYRWEFESVFLTNYKTSRSEGPGTLEQFAVSPNKVKLTEYEYDSAATLIATRTVDWDLKTRALTSSSNVGAWGDTLAGTPPLDLRFVDQSTMALDSVSWSAGRDVDLKPAASDVGVSVERGPAESDSYVNTYSAVPNAAWIKAIAEAGSSTILIGDGPIEIGSRFVDSSQTTQTHWQSTIGDSVELGTFAVVDSVGLDLPAIQVGLDFAKLSHTANRFASDDALIESRDFTWDIQQQNNGDGNLVDLGSNQFAPSEIPHTTLTIGTGDELVQSEVLSLRPWRIRTDLFSPAFGLDHSQYLTMVLPANEWVPGLISRLARSDIMPEMTITSRDDVAGASRIVRQWKLTNVVVASLDLSGTGSEQLIELGLALGGIELSHTRYEPAAAASSVAASSPAASSVADESGPSESPVTAITVTGSINFLATPTAVGIADVSVPNDSPDQSISLPEFFSDTQVTSEDLDYEFAVSGDSTIFASIGLSGTTLIMDFSEDGFGTASVTVTASNQLENSVSDTFDVTTTAEVDFGDAPAPYPTLLADDGARHMAVGPRLGALRDGEPEGFATLLADGDDLGGLNDEDGVWFGCLASGSDSGTLEILLENSSSAKVDAWIDFDGNGRWDDPGEQILSSVTVDTPVSRHGFGLPTGLAAGDYYARVRLSSAAGLASGGLAQDGEVEDYLVTVLSLDAGIVVNTPFDEIDGGCAVGDVSLREAIHFANLNPGSDTITFDASLGGGTITLGGTQLPTITDSLTIVGLGENPVTIDGDLKSRVFEIGPGTEVSISDLVITRGNALNASFPWGGGIYNNEGDLSLQSVTISDSTAIAGGGIYYDGIDSATAVLTVLDSHFFGNSASVGGGIFSRGVISVGSSTFVGNDASSGNGGAIFNLAGYGTFEVSDGFFAQNTAGNGGAVHLAGSGGIPTPNILRTTFTNNVAIGSGGAVWTDSKLELESSTLKGNSAVEGGGIRAAGSRAALTIRQSTFSENVAELGGGLSVVGGAGVEILQSTFSGNRTQNDNGLGGAGLFGFNATIDVIGSTFAYNQAANAAPGGISTTAGSVTTLTSTIVAGNTNSAGASDIGGDPISSASRRNLIGDANSAGGLTDGDNGNLVGIDVATVLDPILASNGGSTQTHALLPDSPAIDANRSAMMYRFEESSGSDVPDASGNLPAVALNGLDLSAAPGVRGSTSAARFDGIDDYISVPDIVTAQHLGGSQYSIEFWINSATDGNFRETILGITEDQTDPVAHTVLVEVRPDGTIRFVNRTPSGSMLGDGHELTSAQSITRHRWHHVAVVRDTSTMQIYIDGNLDPNSITGVTGELPAQMRVAIGRLSQAQSLRYLKGMLDEFAIHDRALSEAEIKSLVANVDQRGVPFARRAGQGLDIGAYERQHVPVLDLIVDTLDDEEDGDYSTGDLSLREAISLANGSIGPDTITFDASLGDGTITLGGTQLPTITDSLTIVGLGENLLTIDGDLKSRVFEIGPGTEVSISDLVITRGNANNASVQWGGGIYNHEGNLSLQGVTISDSTAVWGGGIHNDGIDGATAVLTILDSHFFGNIAGAGGGVFNWGFNGNAKLRVGSSTFVGNDAILTGGAIYNEAGGNAIGTFEVTDGFFAQNTAAEGGAVYLYGNSAIPAPNILRTTFTNNVAATGGGAVWTASELELESSTLKGNSAYEGGGIRAVGIGAALTIRQSTLSDNVADIGGGLSVDGASVEILQSTFSGNRTQNDSALGGAGLFGANTTIDVIGSTFAYNQAANAAPGGISTTAGSVTTLTSTIVAGNTNSAGASDIGGDPVSSASSRNLIGDTDSAGGLTDGVNGNLVGVDVATILDARLADNGGATQTHALLPGSPAINAGAAYADLVLAAGPEAYYRFEEAAGASVIADSSGNQHDSVTLSNVILGVNGRVGGAAQFNGNAYARLGLTLDPNSTDFTIELLARPDDLSGNGNRHLVQQLDGSDAGRTLAFTNAEDQFESLYGGTTATDEPLIEGRWYHLAVVVTQDPGGDTVNLYVDGALKASNTRIGASSDGNWVLGVAKALAGAFWNGLMDEVAIYSRALAEEEMRSHVLALDIVSDQRGLPFLRDDGGGPDIGAYERQVLSSLPLVVDTYLDENDGDYSSGNLSLREAIGLANGSVGADTITFHSSLRGTTITLDGKQLPSIVDDLTISGLGAELLTIDADGKSAVMEVGLGSRVEFANLTISGGSAPRGGGIVNQGLLTIRDSVLANNSADQGGGLFQSGLDSTLDIIGSTFHGNLATLDGGAIYSTEGVGGTRIQIVGSTFAGNTAQQNGGAIFSDGMSVAASRLVVRESTFSGNSAGASGGAIFSQTPALITGSTITLNTSEQGAAFHSISTKSEITSTILAGNLNGEGASGVDVKGAVRSGGHNLIGSITRDNLVRWNTGNGANGHLYELIRVPGGLTWDDASARAFFAGGHLATITSLEENAFVFDLINDRTYWNENIFGTVTIGPLIGGSQPASNPPADNWQWVTGEDFAQFTAWAFGEPNDFGGVDENRLAYFSDRDFDDNGSRDPHHEWADIREDSTESIAYVVEYPDLQLQATDRIGVDPMLGPLAKNGGPTQTHALMPGSPAIDVVATVIPEPTIAYRFEEVVAGEIADSAGNLNGTLVGDLVLSAGSDFLNSGQGLRFDGTGDYVSVADPVTAGQLGGEQYSIAFWIRSTTSDTNRHSVIALTDNQTTTANHAVLIEVRGDDTIRFLNRLPAGVAGGNDLFSAGKVTRGSWNHVAVVRDTGTMKIYIDGVLDDRVITDASGTLPAQMKLVLGRLSETQDFRDFEGDLDDVLFFDHPLSDLEVRALLSQSDQRGVPFARRRGTAIDIGAYERQIAEPGSFVVTTRTDEFDFSNTNVSLREAIHVANGNPGADTITFSPSLAPGTITLNGNQLPIVTESLSIVGLGAARLKIDGNQQSRILQLDPGVTLSVSDLTISGGREESLDPEGTVGGAIRNEGGSLHLSRTVLANNHANYGGAIFNRGVADDETIVTVEDSQFRDNSANYGAGLYNLSNLGDASVDVNRTTFSDNRANAFGGAILNIGNSELGTAAVAIRESTFSENDADRGGAVYNVMFGGETTLRVMKSTFSANAATSGGGGLLNDQGVVVVQDSTFTQNRAGSGGSDAGGGLWTNTPNVSLRNTIVAGNYSGSGTESSDLSGTIDPASSFNLIGDSASAGGLAHGTNDNLVGFEVANVLDPLLVDNGGPTMTHALVAGSPAIDTGFSVELFDQRGAPFARDDGGGVDIGAVERQSLNLVVDEHSDESDGNYSQGKLSLREAIQIANGNELSDTIRFQLFPGFILSLDASLPVITDDLTIDGPGQSDLSIDGMESHRIFQVLGGDVDLTVKDIGLARGRTSEENDGGAAIKFVSTGTLSVDSVYFQRNFVDGSNSHGGALLTDGQTVIRNSTFESNSAFAGHGGAIHVLGPDGVVIRESLLLRNSAEIGGALSIASGSHFLVNSTVSGNNARGGVPHAAAGVAVRGGHLSIFASTITDNLALPSGTGGLSVESGASAEVHSTIIAGNHSMSTPSDVTGQFLANNSEFNLIGDPLTSGGLTHGTGNNQIGQSDGAGGRQLLDISTTLLPLADNGGTTLTHALLPGSSAIDSGAFTEPYDQRGAPFLRQAGVAVDIGAFEYQTFEFGDAPWPYPTTLDRDGAFHAATGPQLGEARDTEPDGQPIVGDGEDEDGVMFGNVRIGGDLAGVNVDVRNLQAGQTARIDAWIDFNDNGIWEPTEKILDSRVVPINGLQTLNFSVPADNRTESGINLFGLKHARVRISSNGGLQPGGFAADGEVEDYLIEVLPSRPQVESVMINEGDDTRAKVTSLTVRFDRPVDHAALNSAFTVTNTTTETVVGAIDVEASDVDGKTFAVLTFSGASTVAAARPDLYLDTLSDGHYRLDILASAVQDSELPGVTMEVDYTFGQRSAGQANNDAFFAFYGDTDGDGDVDGQDYGRFGQTFFRSGRNELFDLTLDRDGDGDVDGQDYGAFGRRFLRSLPL